MAKTEVKIEGLKDLEAALLKIGKESTRKSMMRRVLLKAGAPMAERAKQIAPKEDLQLSEAIDISTKVKNDAGKQAFARVMQGGGGVEAARGAMREARRAAKGEASYVTAYVGVTDRAPHAHMVEFGTAPHINGGAFAGSRHPGTAPQPFLRPAFDTEALPTIERVKKGLTEAILKNAKRAKR